jgi:prepilin-type processing-associated H-X9-DG protein
VETWASILMFTTRATIMPLQAADAGTVNPVSVVCCPNSSFELIPQADLIQNNSAPYPADATDGRQNFTVRYYSRLLYSLPAQAGVYDLGYGINAGTQAGYNFPWPFARHPCNPKNDGSEVTYNKLTSMRHPSELVAIYDGVFMNQGQWGPTAATRVAARHQKMRVTNLLFFDGHAASFLRSDLPPDFWEQSYLSKDSTLNMALVTAYPKTKWRVDQP